MLAQRRPFSSSHSLWAQLMLLPSSRCPPAGRCMRCDSCAASTSTCPPPSAMRPHAVASLLSRHAWLLASPASPIKRVHLNLNASPHRPHMYVIQDDLTHGTYGGNKARKLDAIIPLILQQEATDVVTCGGLQSAHTSAVAAAVTHASAAAADAATASATAPAIAAATAAGPPSSRRSGSVRVHLLVRGERPPVLTGHHLVASMHAASVTYVPRSVYADRRRMLDAKRDELQAADPHAKVFVIEEGAQGARACLGMVRMLHWLATSPDGLPNAWSTAYHLVMESGTGTTAVGAALGVQLLGLPWTVVGVMVAGGHRSYQLKRGCPSRYYLDQEAALSWQFSQEVLTAASAREDTCRGGTTAGAGGTPTGNSPASATGGGLPLEESSSSRLPQQPSALGGDGGGGGSGLPLTWVPRRRPRRFGGVLDGDMAVCKRVAREHGVLLDPIWTLAAWEEAEHLAASFAAGEGRSAASPSMLPNAAVLLHCGGSSLALQGLAQRFPGMV